MSRKEERKEDKKEGERPHANYAELKEVNMTFNKPAKWYMYIVKQVLLHREQCDIKARPNGAAQVVRVAEALKRLHYFTYVKYHTKTVIDNNRLQRFIIVTVKKTKDFQKLYDKREEERKKIIEEIQKNEDKKAKN